MSKKVSIDEMDKAIEKELTDYKDLATDDLKKAVKSAAKTVKQDIQEKAPVLTGRYRDSWKITKTEETTDKLVLTVHAGRYQLTHLLEHGHAKRGGGRVAAIPHIAPAEEAGEKQLEEDIERGLGHG